MDLNRYLIGTRYQDGGRGPVVYDCWGLVRAVLHEQFGVPLLPTLGHISATSPTDKQDGHAQLEGNFAPSAPAPGVLVACYRGGVFEHVGIIVPGGQVLHATRNQILLHPLRVFRRSYQTIGFFSWQH